MECNTPKRTEGPLHNFPVLPDGPPPSDNRRHEPRVKPSNYGAARAYVSWGLNNVLQRIGDLADVGRASLERLQKAHAAAKPYDYSALLWPWMEPSYQHSRHLAQNLAVLELVIEHAKKDRDDRSSAVELLDVDGPTNLWADCPTPELLRQCMTCCGIVEECGREADRWSKLLEDNAAEVAKTEVKA